jgi:hypothetical protein
VETPTERTRPDLTLDSQRVVETIAKLQKRITERFPSAGLGAVCGELLAVAGESSARAQRIARRHVLLRLGLFVLSAGGVGLLAWVLSQLDFSRTAADSVYTVFQGIEAVANLVVLTGGTLLFMITIEQRLKRRRALAALHELRAIVHVIDMHQLTKDPTIVLQGAHPTAASPRRSMTQFELTRYLDYCAEMLALIGKLAALYAERMRDGVVIDAVNDIENLTSGLGRKIWQKITIISALQDKIDTQARPLGEGPR